MRILYNGQLFSPQPTSATAMSIAGGRIVHVGSDEDVIHSCPSGTPSIDLEGKAVLPGLTDSHIHLAQYAASLDVIRCEGLDRDRIMKLVREKTSQLPKGAWILGHCWEQSLWAGEYGSVEELDYAAPDHPVYLTAKSLHAAWVNSLALVTAGIDFKTPDPADGMIIRKSGGYPSGILLEGAMKLVAAIIPKPSDHDLLRSIRFAQSVLNSYGITAIHDFDDYRCRKTLEQLRELGKLTLRIHKQILLDEMDSAIEAGDYFGKGDEWIQTGGIKIFSDGALGQATAAMIEPYTNDSNNRGVLLRSSSEIVEIGRKAVKSSLPLVIHAIGDMANRIVIDAFSQIRQFETANNIQPLRHRIEHVQIIHPQDIPRLHELDITASVQPFHAISDMNMAIEHLGDRCAYAYAYGKMAQYGTRLIFGSDAPVEEPDPFQTIYAACARKRPDGFPSPTGWYPENGIVMHQALKFHLHTPAYAAGWEKWYGSLAPGCAADLVILPKDPGQLPLEDISSLKPDRVMVDGKWVVGE